MRILALDTSTPRVTVALTDNGEVVREHVGGELRGSQFHGELLAGLVRECLAGILPDLIAVGRGPGPYTGLRVGIVTAEVLGAVWGVPVVGVPTLHAVAAGYRRRGGGACVSALDVKRKEIAWQEFDATGNALREPALLPILDLDQLPEVPLVGPAFVTQTLVSPPVADETPVSAVDIALLAAQLPREGAVQPLYLRAPDAADPKPAKPVNQ